MKMKPQFNVRKAAVYAVVINVLQILSMGALAGYILIDGVNQALHGLLGDVIVLALFGVVTWGAVVDIKEAVHAMKMHVKLHGLDETVSQMSDLNRALRAQRHDFLNHLQVVYSLIEMGEHEEANRYIEQVYGDIQSVSQSLKTACAPVNALLRAKMAEAEQRKITLEVSVHASWKDLSLPAWEMCRVLSNLIDNAMDALEGKAEARIEVILSEDVKNCAFVVRNNGPMIPEDTQASIFEPGFSGKGEGRGMGLFIARETMRNAGGDLTVESNPDFTAFFGFVPHSRIPKAE
ncbi:MAG: Spo0B domain-containing protein [Clostridiales bacterium]|nr:Spo0B domain-containing protein [Clostridiales bacterium]